MADLPRDVREELIQGARTTTGDELRSLTYFTDETIDQIYLRDDLEQSADLVGFAENERHGFRSQMVYRNTQLGSYDFTIRVFENGYLTRVMEGDHGVWITTDAMRINRFEDLASAVSSTLASFEPETA